MMSPEELLKIRIMSEGISITPRACDRIAAAGEVTLAIGEYATTSGVGIRFGGDVYVNAPFIEDFTQDAAVQLDADKDGYALQVDGQTWPAELIPEPAYYRELNSSGRPHSDCIRTHTDRARVSPIQGCSFGCLFCDSPRSLAYRKKPIQDLLEAVTAATGDPILPAKHLLISGGTPRREDRGYLSEAYKAICQHSPVPVTIMMAARDDSDYPAMLKQWGARELSVNVELYDPAARARYIPEKNALGMNDILKFIGSAVRAMDVGNVRSALLVGLEPIQSTLDGVRALVDIGCDPMLSPFRPSPKTPLAAVPPPGIEVMARVYEASYDVATKAGALLAPRCIPCQHNTLTFPRGDRYFYSS